MPSARKILILGGVAHENRGDLAMQAGLVQWLRKTAPDAELLFFSSDPEPTEAAFGLPCEMAVDAELATEWTRETPTSTSQRRRAIRRGRRFLRNARLHRTFGRSFASPTARRFFGELAEASCVLVPGSGSMNSLWWHDWLYPKAFSVLAARAMSVPVAMSSQGVGPSFDHPLDAKLAAEMFSACELVGVRDREASAGVLEEIGVARSKIHHSGDDALLFSSTVAPPELPSGAGPCVGVNLRDSAGYRKGYAKLDPARVAGILDAVAEASGCRFVFIPISYDKHDDDRESARAVVAEMRHRELATVITDTHDAAGIRSLCGQLDFAIGISYHFSLFCLAASVPSLLLYQNPYYAQKALGLARLYGDESRALDLEAVSDDDLLDRITGDLARAPEIRAQLREQNEMLEQECDTTRIQLARLVSGKTC